ncbi:unnamed protein product [Mytilus edulis]|uniref:Uncharacterized protein n=1 Tax=Mytilus edulis TaxID=6550 RepID=A0A8S3UBY1_MYTED|nr:unnamed protein product [Mytilus edulis]
MMFLFKGYSVLHQAASEGEHNYMKTLISLGANVSARNKKNQTPLHLARNKEVVELLIQNGADVNCKDSNNQTPLHLARVKEVAETLILNGADVNSRDSNVMADNSNGGIIGIDFLVTYDCDVLVSQHELKIKRDIIQCHYASSAKSCYRVVIQETVDVPPNSEMIVSGD